MTQTTAIMNYPPYCICGKTSICDGTGTCKDAKYSTAIASTTINLSPATDPRVTQLIAAMQEAITILEPTLQAIRYRRPTTAGLGGIEARLKGAIGQLSEALKNIEK